MDYFIPWIPNFIAPKGPMTLGREVRGLTFSGSRLMASDLVLIFRQGVKDAPISRLNEIFALERFLHAHAVRQEKIASTLVEAHFV